MGIVIPKSEFTRHGKLPDVKDFENPSGIQPVEFKCLIKPFAIAETDAAIKSAREAGLIIDDATSEREQYAQCIALLVAVGGNAFEDWSGEVPKPGDRITIAKYAGVSQLGADGRGYRIVSDKDIAGILFDPSEEDPLCA